MNIHHVAMFTVVLAIELKPVLEFAASKKCDVLDSPFYKVLHWIHPKVIRETTEPITLQFDPLSSYCI
jgi:hypothetical protein